MNGLRVEVMIGGGLQLACAACFHEKKEHEEQKEQPSKDNLADLTQEGGEWDDYKKPLTSTKRSGGSCKEGSVPSRRKEEERT